MHKTKRSTETRNPAERTYTQQELRRRLHALAWLLVECVDDHVGTPYMDGRVPPDHSPETRAGLLADYASVLKRRRLKMTAAARKEALAKYERYLSGPFPTGKYPLMGSSNPSWETRRALLHDIGERLAEAYSQPRWFLDNEDDAVDEDAHYEKEEEGR